MLIEPDGLRIRHRPMTRAEQLSLGLNLVAWSLVWMSHFVSRPWRTILSIPLVISGLATVVQMIRRRREQDRPVVMDLNRRSAD